MASLDAIHRHDDSVNRCGTIPRFGVAAADLDENLLSENTSDKADSKTSSARAFKPSAIELL
jgi:hypothetical protein